MERLNTLQREEAEAEFLKCCGSTLWARRMAEERPFHDLQQLLAQADADWWALDPEDWLEAFSRHPKIGETARPRCSWSEQEQAGAKSADDETRQQLAAANREYESRFGHIYIVCATGKTADEMLSLCRERLSNDPDDRAAHRRRGAAPHHAPAFKETIRRGVRSQKSGVRMKSTNRFSFILTPDF